jgi:predicted neutral ceramidase superfamily lipid hydrolase
MLSSLRSIGIDEGEIFTTDTHAVTALILTKGGYHPVGEAMENEKLINYIKEATVDALAKLEKTGFSCRSITVPNVKVIGAKKLEALSSLIEEAIQRSKRTMVPVFGVSGLLLMLLLLFV